jgi:cytochrome P450 family 150 subfamily A5
MTDIDSVDFFTDNDLLRDPNDYLSALRDECPLRREKHHDVVMVTGYNESMRSTTIRSDSRRASR